MVGYIGLPRSIFITTCETSISVVVIGATAIRSGQSGFVLFTLINNSPLYHFNATVQQSILKLKDHHFISYSFNKRCLIVQLSIK
jgi:hypothetical protein